MEQRQPFHLQLKYERERRGWSQADLAEKVGSDFKTVQRWESGGSVPRPYYRQQCCNLFGKSAEELGLTQKGDTCSPLPSNLKREDWGEAPLGGNFYGRDKELALLEQWIHDHHCCVVTVLGIGGIGKTAFAARVASRLRSKFECIFWRSLQNMPSLTQVLKQGIRCVSGQQCVDPPDNVDDQMLLLIQYLQEHRCLIVLDNVESILRGGQHTGQYVSGYENYGRLVQHIGEAQHRSCLLLTSREKPKEVALLEGSTSPVRSFQLPGVGFTEGRAILQDKDLSGADAQWATLVELYSGNPLALKLVSEAIREIFEGNIAHFLQGEEIVFGDINDLIAQQYHRLTMQEREILYWLAIEREAVPLENIYANLVRSALKGEILTALDSLRRRSLIETRGSAMFTLQPVIMEYITNDFIKRACQEFSTEMHELWTNFALYKAQSKDYIRESQKRLILAPIAQQLLEQIGEKGVELGVRRMLVAQRQMHAAQYSYAGSNALKLLIHLGYDLRDADFSHLTIRQAYLQDLVLPQVNFSHVHFSASIFTSTFGNVLTVAFSHSNHLVSIGTAVGEIWIYQTLSGMPLMNYRGHTDGVWGVTFHPDERILASCSDDQAVRLWDVSTGHCLKILQSHTNRVRSVAFSPDGQVLASGSDDSTIRLWDVNTGHCFLVLRGHTDRVWSVAFSPDGLTLASGSTDNTICLWDTQTGHCLKTLQGHTNWVRSVAFSPEGKMLASGGDDQTIRLWETNSGYCITTLRGHTNRIWSISFSPMGAILASGSEDQSIRLWDIGSGSCFRTLQGHMHGVRSVSISFDGDMLVSGGDDQTVHIWEMKTGACLKTLQSYTNRIWSVAFSPDSQMIVSCSEDQSIRLWNTTTGTCWKVLRDEAHRAKMVTINPGGSLLASGGEDQAVRIWDILTGRCLHNLSGHTNWVRSVAFSPDGNLLASGSEDNIVRIWDVNASRCLLTLQGHNSWVRSVAFSPDGNLLASGSDDQTIRVWDTCNGHCLFTLKGHTGRVRSIAFSSDGKHLASGSEDHTVCLWNTKTFHCIIPLYGHTNWVRSVAFSPDGKLLASSGDDHTIRLWDTGTYQCLNIFQGHTNRVRSISFALNGQMLTSGSDDGTIKIWNVQMAKCTQTLINERPYEDMDITGVSGLTEAQKAALRSLGAKVVPPKVQ